MAILPEMQNPVAREEFHASGRIAGDETLFILILIGHFLRVGPELFLQRQKLADGKAKERALAEPFERRCLVAGHDDIIRPSNFEKVIKGRQRRPDRGRDRGPARSGFRASVPKASLFGQMPLVLTGISTSRGGRSSHRMRGLRLSRQSVKHVKVKGGVMLRATIAQSRLMKVGPYLVPQLMQITCLTPPLAAKTCVIIARHFRTRNRNPSQPRWAVHGPASGFNWE